VAKEHVPHEGPVVTRDEARAAGLKRFFTGKLCKHLHLSERKTANGACVACDLIANLAAYHAETDEARAARNARMRAWADENREKVREKGRAYASANREQRAAWKAANRERVNAAERDARQRNPEAYKAIHDRYAATDKGRAGSSRRSTKWQAENRDAVRVIVHRRRAREKNAEGAHTAEDIKRIGDAQSWKCHWCKKPTRRCYHVDHIVPLAKGGSNWPSNLAIACPACNQRKHASDPIAFAQRLGLLL
jgi:5-methylcytosine-specific restriction endonuclease McrA